MRPADGRSAGRAVELFLIDDLTGQLAPAGSWSRPGADVGGLFGRAPVVDGEPIWVPETEDEVCRRYGRHTVLSVPVRDGGEVLGVLVCYAGAPETQEDLFTMLLDGVASQIGVHLALRRAEELTRQLARSQNDFVDVVGHELRTPLASIAALAAMLADDPGGLDDSREMIAGIARNADTLYGIVTRLLDLAGLDGGHLPLAIGPVDLSATVTDACRRAERAGRRLVLDVPPGLALDGDARRLRQVADDLLSNAVNYSPPDGAIRVALEQGEDLLTLTIADDGIGTPADERDHVFNRFYRASNVRHNGTPGSELGLSRARTIVLLHHGTISLAANRPTGTAVTVRLPLRVRR